MTAPSPLAIRHQALAFLVATAAPECQRVWRSARDVAREILRAVRRGCSEQDAYWYRLTLTELAEELAEWEREAYEPCGYHFDERDFVDYAATRGGRGEG
jgi:hypothetical protein